MAKVLGDFNYPFSFGGGIRKIKEGGGSMVHSYLIYGPRFIIFTFKIILLFALLFAKLGA